MSDTAASRFMDSVDILPAKDFPTEQDVLVTYQEMWITYRVGSTISSAPTYSHIVIFLSEIDAYRYAVKNKTEVVLINPGQSLEDAINVSRKNSSN